MLLNKCVVRKEFLEKKKSWVAWWCSVWFDPSEAEMLRNDVEEKLERDKEGGF